MKDVRNLNVSSTALHVNATPMGLHANSFMMMNAVPAQVPPVWKNKPNKPGSGSKGKDEHSADKVKQMIDSNSNFGKFIQLYRKGMMFIACGLAIWTPIDCIYTGICWPTALNPVQFPENYAAAVWMRFKPVVGFIAWLISTAASMPLAKTTCRRRADGVVYRWVLWAAKGVMNFTKLRLPENMKAPKLA